MIARFTESFIIHKVRLVPTAGTCYVVLCQLWNFMVTLREIQFNPYSTRGFGQTLITRVRGRGDSFLHILILNNFRFMHNPPKMPLNTLKWHFAPYGI